MPTERALKDIDEEQTQDDSSCVFADKTKRHTNSNFPVYINRYIYTNYELFANRGVNISSYNTIKCLNIIFC